MRPQKSYEIGHKLNLDNKVQQLLSKQKHINWGDLLVNDMRQFITLLENNPIKYDFSDINQFIKLIYKTQDLKHMTKDKYQYIMKVLVQKANDDHTCIQFYIPQYQYSGFTAIFDTFQLLETSNDKEYYNIESNQQNMSDKQLENKEIHSMRLIVDVVNDIYLMEHLQQGDLITHINNKSYLEYMLDVAKFSERKTNTLSYNLQKTALRLGIYNYIFPVKTIQVERIRSKEKSTIKITLQYKNMDNSLLFKNNQFEKYIQIHQNKVRSTIQDEFNLLDSKTMYVRLVHFNSPQEHSKMLNFINKHKSSKKSQINMIIVDIRGNSGGNSHGLLEIESTIIDPSFANLVFFYETIKSIQEPYSSISLNKKISNTINNQKLSLTDKKRIIQQFIDQYDIQKYNVKKGKTLQAEYSIKTPEENEWLSNPQKLLQLQIDQVSAVLKKKSPSIVLLTDQYCRSSCSIFAKFTALFPHVLIVGREVQGFNQSGDVEPIELQSGCGRLKIPTVSAIIQPNIRKYLLKTLTPHITIPNNKFPNNYEEMKKWTSVNKSHFIEKINKNCKLFLKQQNDKI